MPELKNCPFCGETPQLKHAVGEYWPLCKCEVSGRSTSTEAGAIAAWNRRVPPPPDRGMVEESLSDTGELLRQAEVAALEWLNCDRYSKRLGALRALPDCDDTNGRKNVALRMLRAVRASTASQPQPERLSMVGAWQSMDSAPKDGTSVLGFDGLGIAIMDWWQPDQEDLEEGAVAGWVSHSNETEEFIEAPTHWMPLPASPSIQTLQGEE